MSTEQVIALVAQLGVPAVLLGLLIWRLVPAVTSVAERIIAAQQGTTAAIKEGFLRIEDKVTSSQRETEAQIVASQREVEDAIRDREVANGGRVSSGRIR